MSDRAFDFDELDEAVNSMMSNKPAKRAGGYSRSDKNSEDKPEQTLDLDATSDLPDDLFVEPDEEVVEDKPEETSDEKSDGSTDDVNDEKPEETTDEQHDEQSDEKPEDVTEQPESEPESEPEPETESEPEQKPTPRPISRPASGRHMDIVRSPGNKRIGRTVAPVSTAAPAPLTPPEVTEAPQPPEEELLQTPFLPNANEKVVKRPLGGRWPFAKKSPVPTEPEVPEHEDEAEKEPPVENETAEPKESETKPEPEASVKEEPAEPNKDNQVTEQPLDEPDMSPEEASEARELQAIESLEINELESKLEKEEKEEPTIREVESGDTGHLHGDGEEETKQTINDNKSAAIYDTTDYHQPLAHPAKRKSGIGIVIAVVLIIVVCIALAAAAYFIFGIGISK